MHISMRLKNIMNGHWPGQDPRDRGVLYKGPGVTGQAHVSICADPAVTSPSMKAIRRALPGRSPGRTRSILLCVCVCLELFIEPNATMYACNLVQEHQSSTSLLECCSLP